MAEQQSHPLIKRISEGYSSLTPKGRILSDRIMKNPKKSVFMTIKQLASAAQVGEATVFRFVRQLGYEGYSDFRRALRDLVDTELTLMDRVRLYGMRGIKANPFLELISKENENLKYLFEKVDISHLNKAVDYLQKSPVIYVVSSRFSFTLAYYLGWALTKVRRNVNTLNGSDIAMIDLLVIAPQGSLVVIIDTSRYLNELIKISKVVRRLGHTLLVITDSTICPHISFANLNLIAPLKHISAFGSLTTFSCLIGYLIEEFVRRNERSVKKHQERIERWNLENDIFFNLDRTLIS